MFGYVVADGRQLTKEQNERYNQVYCGLCHCLEDKYGRAGRLTLTYDMTFLSLLLSSLYGVEERKGQERCPAHPVGGRKYCELSCTEYAADMNVLLAYYKCIDDWNDDKKRRARDFAERLSPFVCDIEEKWPRQGLSVKRGLEILGDMERRNVLNPDLPANCFGEMMGELFVIEEDELSPTLRLMGAALGRFVYLLDAVCDLRQDIKKCRYNPLISKMDTDFTPILMVMMGECTEHFERMPVSRDKDILRNILYSGVWARAKKKALKLQGAEG